MSLLFLLILGHILTGALVLLKEKRMHGIDQSAAVADNNRKAQLFLIFLWPTLGWRVRELLACSLPALGLVLAFMWAPAFVMRTAPTVGIAAIMVLVVTVYALIKRPNPNF